MRLEREKVVIAALGLLDETGLDGLSTRRLAEALGVQGPALYWHFKNKQELIDEMAHALLKGAFLPIAPGESWSDWLSESARRLRRAMLSHRDGARLLAGLRPSEPHGRVNPLVLPGPWAELGLGMPDSLWACLNVTLFTFGWTMDEQAALVRDPPFSSQFDPNEGFEFGLATIIAGLRARVAATTPAEPAEAAS